MKKVLGIALTDRELQELCRILLDKDQEGALVFLEEHLRKPADEALQGG